MAAKAYARTGAYDAAISRWFAGELGETWPERLVLAAGKQLEVLGERALLLPDERELERVTKLAAEVGVILDPPPAPEVIRPKPRKRRWRGRRRRKRD